MGGIQGLSQGMLYILNLLYKKSHLTRRRIISRTMPTARERICGRSNRHQKRQMAPDGQELLNILKRKGPEEPFLHSTILF
ncbi:hypothetical protein GDO78_021139 [Eleutherodactylus coqui]|uniref:Uncharacterized protein n=1 Tax=Eleutherodactylus coqui TaxID=57060 RepID=A0A8J6EBP3_ELECQ|nr:hypothetical protein GDO78_021139 [Eleutherodactylus coqui]